MKYLEIKESDYKLIKEVSELASKIVKEHYDPIVGETQNEYMIKKFQSASSIKEQLSQNYRYFFVLNEEGKRVGFIAFYPREKDLYLSKFYLEKNERGKGMAKNMFAFVKNEARKSGFSSIVLNVNKYNAIAIRAYEKLGMGKIAEEKIDIGRGYYMDDYVYQFVI